MYLGYTVNFSPDKAGLSNVQFAFIDNVGNIIGSWSNSGVFELVANTGIYSIYYDSPGNAYWLAWRTGDTIDERFLVVALRLDTFTFHFGIDYIGENIAYRFINSEGDFTGIEITTGIIELFEVGIYVVNNSLIPQDAVFIIAYTETPDQVYLGGTIDVSTGKNIVVPREGEFSEEVPE